MRLKYTQGQQQRTMTGTEEREGWCRKKKGQIVGNQERDDDAQVGVSKKRRAVVHR